MSTVAGSSAGAEAGLFVRKSSGLVREIGVLSAVGIAVGSIILTAMPINVYVGMVSFTQSDFYVPIILGGLIWAVAMFGYQPLVQAIPRAGGEYVYVSRIISPAAGAAVGIFMAVVFIYTAASLARTVAGTLPFTFTALGSAFGSDSLANAGSHVTSNLAVFLISSAVMILIGLLAMLSLRTVAKILVWCMVVEVAAVIALGVVLAIHSQADFSAAFGHYSHNPNAYQSMISLGKANGVLYGISIATMVSLVPFYILAYNGVLFNVYVGGELKRPSRTFLYASAVAIGMEAAVYLGLWALMRKTVGLHFIQAQTNLFGTDAYGHITNLDASVSGLGYGLVLSGDPISKILFAVAVPVGFAAAALAFLVGTARIVLALSFDRMLPVGLAKVSERSHSPVVAVLTVTAASVAFCILLVYGSLSNIFALLALFLCMILVSGGVAATFLAHRRPDLVRRAGDGEIVRWLGLPRSTWLGGATTALALFATIEVLAHPSVYGGYTTSSVTSLVVVILAGPVIYVISRAIWRRRHQIDLSLAMHELPPD